MAEQEHWSAYNAGIPGPAGAYWIVGRGMRLVATCQRPEDAERIASDHSRAEALQGNTLDGAMLDTMEQVAQRHAETGGSFPWRVDEVLDLIATIRALQADLAAQRERAAELAGAAQDLVNSDLGAGAELSQPYALRQMVSVLARRTASKKGGVG